MLHGENGFEVLGEIRKLYAVPVIMLTAKNSPSDKVSGNQNSVHDPHFSVLSSLILYTVHTATLKLYVEIRTITSI